MARKKYRSRARKLIPKETLQELYVDSRLSMSRVGKTLGLDPRDVRYSLIEHGIPTRSRRSYYKDITGQRFGRLVAVEREKANSLDTTALWICQCDCGNVKKIRGPSLRAGVVLSCGCYRKDLMYQGVGDLSGAYWRRVLSGAASRSLEVSLSQEDAWSLFVSQEGKCAVSGLPISLVRDLTRNRKGNTASLDRINNSEGYTKGNCQWVHKDINMMRRKIPIEKFVAICKEVASWNSKT